MKKCPGLFSDVARKCSSRMVFHSFEGKKGRERPRKKEFSSPMWKNKRDEREVHQHITKRGKERKEKEFTSSRLKYKRFKMRGGKRRSRRQN